MNPKIIFSNISAKLALIVLAGIMLLPNGCSAPQHEGFAIYLTRGDVPPTQMPALSHVEIADQPIIGMSDIVAYNAQTHELKLTAEAFKRIAELQVPVQGKSFMVCVDRKAVYAGAFWTPISSIGYDGVTIWKPLGTQEMTIVTLELGYPSASFYGGEDPRNNAEIISAFERAGKLIDRLSVTAVNQLPRSMKGYELYSWTQDGQWHFTLITGTNRNKTVEEITSGEDFISETGWVQIQAVGVEAIKAVLGKLPRGEEIFWPSSLGTGQSPQGAVIALPAKPTVDNIVGYARELGLNLAVQTF